MYAAFPRSHAYDYIPLNRRKNHLLSESSTHVAYSVHSIRDETNGLHPVHNMRALSDERFFNVLMTFFYCSTRTVFNIHTPKAATKKSEFFDYCSPLGLVVIVMEQETKSEYHVYKLH